MDPSLGKNECEHSFSILTRAHSIAVERFHGMEQVGVRLPVGPPNLICIRIDRARAKDASEERYSQKFVLQFGCW